ncbi:DUF4192 family protein [Neomicrococcus aestuarii]|uniref:DUF4192 domain-containing protein n=1 Tax=Neomicrococcus aestuarii TaxID=556325 RepID=A0A1L2ZK45_9MICC|nr:DUF4192 family protein [Neomicrococcus aestuarii]APF39763.1 hypothetical protein BHE16_00575 [Neomicrococcus aestuarii]MBB5513791.1 hypothetical protein [Neomicrococcus aestuarii]
MTTPSETLRIADAAGILAAVPHQLRFHPSESIVVVLATDDRWLATARVDLPPLDASSLTVFDFADAVAEKVCEVPTMTRVFIAAYSDRKDAGPLVAEVKRAFDDRDCRVVDMWLVTDDAWFTLSCFHDECDEGYCEFAAAKSLEQLELHEAHLHSIVRGSSPSHEPVLPSPRVVWQRKDAIRRHAAQFAQQGVFDFERAEVLLLWLEYQELPLMTSLVRLQERPEVVGRLLASLLDIEVRDALMASFLVTAGTVQHFASQMPRAIKNDCAYLDAMATTSALGNGIPVWDRLDRCAELAQELMSAADGRELTILFSILSWVEWMRGRGSSALACAEKARAMDPEYSLAQLMVDVVMHGYQPRWVTDPELAWRS